MKVKKKFYAIVLSAAMLLSVGSLGAFAANGHDNSVFTFDFPIGTNVNYTATRTKYESTSIYIKLQQLLGEGNYNYGIRVSAVDKNKNNFSRTWYLTLTKSDINQARYLKNYAYEDNGNNATSVRVKAERNIPHGYYGSGVWSPDSY